MGIRERRSDRVGRPPLSSPGRPPVAGREEQRRFWVGIAAGLASEDAAIGPVSRRLSEQDGSGRPAACHQRCLNDRRSGFPGGTCRWRSGRSLRSCVRRARAYGRSPDRWDGRRRRSRGSCGATPRRGAAAWTIGRLSRNGMLNGLLGARSLRSWRSTGRCGRMCKIDWLAWSSRQVGLRSPVRRCPGRVADTGPGRIGVGLPREARSRLPIACGSTSRTMRRCASATKPFTSLFTCKAVAPCAAS